MATNDLESNDGGLTVREVYDRLTLSRQAVEQYQSDDARYERRQNAPGDKPECSSPLFSAFFRILGHSKSAIFNLTPRRRECHAFFLKISGAPDFATGRLVQLDAGEDSAFRFSTWGVFLIAAIGASHMTANVR